MVEGVADQDFFLQGQVCVSMGHVWRHRKNKVPNTLSTEHRLILLVFLGTHNQLQQTSYHIRP